MTTLDYKSIYSSLSSQYNELNEMRTELEVRLGDLNKELESIEKTLAQLSSLAGYAYSGNGSIADLGITEAVRFVLDKAVRMSATEVRMKMAERGFDFSKYSAPDASIRTILKRLVDSKKAEAEKEGYRIFYRSLVTADDILL